jgi:hypothetical protein
MQHRIINKISQRTSGADEVRDSRGNA